MRHWPILLCALSATTALAIATPATQARADEADNVADVKCVVVALALTQSQDAQVKAFAPAAALYFVGRLDGRAPDLDLEAAVIKQVNTLSPDALRGEFKRCGGILQSRGDKLRVMGADLQKIAGQAAAAAPSK